MDAEPAFPARAASGPPWLRKMADLLATPIPYFAALSLAYLFLHEPWSDETRAWVLVRDTHGLPGLFTELHYEGHPSLWYLLLYPLAKLGLPLRSMGLLHAALATTGVALLWHKGPFSRLERWLIPFGYFIAFEYDAIPRGYVLVSLLLFLLAALDARRTSSPLLYAAVLAVLANVEVHSLLFVGILALGIAHERWKGKSWTRTTWVAAAIVGLGMLAAVLSVWPLPHDVSPDYLGWRFRLASMSTVLKSVYVAFLPLPAATPMFWDTTAFSAWASWAKVLLAASLLVGSFLAVGRDRRVRVMYAASVGALAFFLGFKWYGGARHAGLLFLVFLYFLWLGRARTASKTHNPLKPEVAPLRKAWFRPQALAMSFVAIILVAQVVAAAVAVHAEATGAFSAGAETARFLKQQGYLDGRTQIAFFRSDRATSVIAPLEDPTVRFFLPELRQSATFARWTTDMEYDRGVAMPLDEVLARMDAAAAGFQRQVLIVGIPLHGSPGAFARLHLVADFRSVVATDALSVYEVR